MTGAFSNPRSRFLRDEYRARINRVMDHIEKNISGELPLESLARVANFSMYHFHRIFTAMTGEPLSRFIQRIRVEKAANLLAASPKMSITEIAYACGFSGSAAFARSFRDYFGMSATAWRALPEKEKSKIRKTGSKAGKTKSKGGKDITASSGYLQDNQITERRNRMLKKLNVAVKDLPETPVAYVRHIGPYQGDGALFEKLIGKLCSWAGPRGLLNGKAQMLAVYHDNPEITDGDKLRLSMCLTVPEGTKVDGEIGTMKLQGGKYAVASFELAEDEYQAAWDALYGDWMPESGYQPDDGPCFELYKNDPATHPQGKCLVDICVPVKPL
jgi:AraC family transcriptional regulator